jgi:tRNA (adenine57-N1/adenine58-N1)-methyltransferase
METLVRYWHVKEMSVRPQHRMVAHTGFVTTARRTEKEPSSTPVQNPGERSGEEAGGDGP